MSWNGAGVFNRLYNWVNDKNAAINITASRMDADANDITANGLGNCITRDGQGQPSGNLPMATFRHTNVADGVSRTDYASLGQSQDGKINWVAAGGSADALAATYIPALTALVDGQLCFLRAVAANATTTPTFAPNGLTAHTITKIGGAPLAAADINATGHEIILRYNLANTRWELLNPAAPIVYSNDAGAGVGPSLDLFRDSVSPAVSDFIGSVDFNGRDSGAAKQLYAQLAAQITDATAASEDAIWILRAVVAGTLTDMLKSSAAGIVIPGTLGVTGLATISATLGVTGKATFSGLANFASAAYASTTAGDVEYDGKAMAYNPVASARGIIPAVHFLRISADQTGTNVNTSQPWFPGGGSTQIAAAASTTYFFEGLLYLARTAGTTAHTISVGFNTGATFTSCNWLLEATSSTGNVLSSFSAIRADTNSSVTATLNNGSATENVIIRVSGIMSVASAGSIQPIFTFSAAPGGAPTIKANSYFRMYPVGTDTVLSVGNVS